ncbi:hypothetical protein JXA48_01310 [Candidatus Woesearchaeota archaeon]|nr:hypothetical protein [Candidatus Woesearchaeota archaeon]
MAYGFESLIYTLDNWGLLDVILPFILIFTLVFAIFEKTKILSDDDDKNKKYSAVIAMVMAFGVVIPHVTGNYYYGFDAVEIINRALPQVSLLLVAILMTLLTLGLWTGKRADGSKGPGKWFTLASGVIVILIFIGSIGWWNVPSWVYRLLSSEIIPLVVAILVFGLIIKFITGDGKKPDDIAAREKRIAARNKGIEEFLTGVGSKKE